MSRAGNRSGPGTRPGPQPKEGQPGEGHMDVSELEKPTDQPSATGGLPKRDYGASLLKRIAELEAANAGLHEELLRRPMAADGGGKVASIGPDGTGAVPGALARVACEAFWGAVRAGQAAEDAIGTDGLHPDAAWAWAQSMGTGHAWRAVVSALLTSHGRLLGALAELAGSWGEPLDEAAAAGDELAGQVAREACARQLLAALAAVPEPGGTSTEAAGEERNPVIPAAR